MRGNPTLNFGLTFDSYFLGEPFYSSSSAAVLVVLEITEPTVIGILVPIASLDWLDSLVAAADTDF